MNIKQHVSFAFINDNTPPQKVAFGNNVIVALTAASASFPNLHLSVKQLTALNNTLENAIGPAMGGDTHAVSVRNAAEDAWDAGFRLTASDVDNQAQGDPAIISLAGFTATTGTRSPKGVPADAVFEQKPSPTAGGVHLSLVAQSRIATAYVAVAAPDGASIQFAADNIVITLATGEKVYVSASTSSDIDITGMAPDVRVTVGARAINSAGAGGGATASLRTGD